MQLIFTIISCLIFQITFASGWDSCSTRFDSIQKTKKITCYGIRIKNQRSSSIRDIRVLNKHDKLIYESVEILSLDSAKNSIQFLHLKRSLPDASTQVIIIPLKGQAKFQLYDPQGKLLYSNAIDRETALSYRLP